jgi:hypothetical protein
MYISRDGIVWEFPTGTIRMIPGQGRAVSQVVEVPGLVASTKYYVRGKIRNAKRWSRWGPVLTCSTSAAIPPSQVSLCCDLFSLPSIVCRPMCHPCRIFLGFALLLYTCTALHRSHLHRNVYTCLFCTGPKGHIFERHYFIRQGQLGMPG